MSEESTPEKRGKFIPSLAQLKSVLGQLPSPQSTLDETFKAYIDANLARPIEFDRIIVKKSDGSKSPKWSYKGRIFIDSKYIVSVDDKHKTGTKNEK